MYTLYETPREFDPLTRELKELVECLISRFRKSIRTLHLPACADLSTPDYRNGKLHIVRDGMMAYCREGTNVFFYDEGDMIGLELQLPPNDSYSIQSDLAVVVDELPLDVVIDALPNDPELLATWNRLLSCQMSLYLLCLSSLARDPQDHHPEVRPVDSGEVIMRQGTPATEVCTMVEGGANVLVDGVKVGEILPGETFGAVAALTDRLRTATVVTTKDCVIMSMRHDQVRRLISSRPNTALKLIQDLSRIIIDLDQNLADILAGKEVSLNSASKS